MDILEELSAPFPPDKIHWRVGATNKDKTKGLALAYLDARDVQERLDAVCSGLWQVEHTWGVGNKVACRIGIFNEAIEQWVWRGDGAGATDVEGDKGSFSDSFKRAAVQWGVGRYLYDVESPWVQLKPQGKSYVIDEREYPRLQKLLVPTSRPGNGVPTVAEVRDHETRIVREVEDASPHAIAEILQRNDSYIQLIRTKKPDWYAELMARANSLMDGASNNQDLKASPALKWKNKACEEVAKCSTKEEVDAWEELNTARITKLQKTDNDLYLALNNFIAKHVQSLNEAA